jgi:hypothetical protein
MILGSIDSLNNIENYSLNGFRSNAGPVAPSILLPNHTVTTTAKQQQQNYQYSKPKTLNLNNMSLSDLTNGVRYKNSKESQRSGSSSPEGNDNGYSSLSQRQRHPDELIKASRLSK